MVGTQHRAQVGGDLVGLVDGGFVKVVAHHIHAIRTGQVVKPITVQVLHLNAARRLQEAATFESLSQVGTELVGHTIVADELQIRDVAFGLRRHGDALGVTLRVGLAQRIKTLTTLRNDVLGCSISTEKLSFVVGIAGDHGHHTFGHARVAGQRAMFSPREFKTLFRPGQAGSQSAQSESGKGEVVHQVLPERILFNFIN